MNKEINRDSFFFGYVRLKFDVVYVCSDIPTAHLLKHVKTYASNCLCYDRHVDFVSVLDVQLYCKLLEDRALAHYSVNL